VACSLVENAPSVRRDVSVTVNPVLIDVRRVAATEVRGVVRVEIGLNVSVATAVIADSDVEIVGIAQVDNGLTIDETVRVVSGDPVTPMALRMRLRPGVHSLAVMSVELSLKDVQTTALTGVRTDVMTGSEDVQT
jgi:hypothetical protein